MTRHSCGGGNPCRLQRDVGTIPLVLHRVVRGASDVFEDVAEETLASIVHFIANGWITFDSGAGLRLTDSWNWLLTFDDGYSSDFEVAFPVLQNAGVKAVFFLITEKVGTSGHLSWAQVREMRRYGMEFGSHGLTHSRMTMLACRDARKELTRSRLDIEDRLGEQIRVFSFPYGYYSAALVQLALEAGYSSCCTSDHGTVKLPARVIPRNSINKAMRWPAILRTLDPSPLVRLGWTVEDWSKKNIKRVAGDRTYRALREAFTWNRKR